MISAPGTISTHPAAAASLNRETDAGVRQELRDPEQDRKARDQPDEADIRPPCR